MCISGLIVGEILLTVQMALKQAVGPAILAAMTIGPTFLFSKGTKEQYLRAFQDAALLQTSLLDGWDTAMEYSVDNREEFRQFLVDAHKAAYVRITTPRSTGYISDSRVFRRSLFVWPERTLMNF